MHNGGRVHLRRGRRRPHGASAPSPTAELPPTQTCWARLRAQTAPPAHAPRGRPPRPAGATPASTCRRRRPAPAWRGQACASCSAASCSGTRSTCPRAVRVHSLHRYHGSVVSSLPRRAVSCPRRARRRSNSGAERAGLAGYWVGGGGPVVVVFGGVGARDHAERRRHRDGRAAPVRERGWGTSGCAAALRSLYSAQGAGLPPEGVAPLRLWAE